LRPPKHSCSKFILFCSCCLFLLLPTGNALTIEQNPEPVGIFISQEILPYMQMVQGLEKNLDQTTIRVFLDSYGNPYSQETRFQELRPKDFSAMVAVGPRALAYLKEHHWPGKIIYAMVLNPERFSWKTADLCGISLNLNPWKQLITVARVFPRLRRLGILFNPEKNQRWFTKAKTLMNLKNLTLIPLKIKERADIPKLFIPPGPQVDGILFIPDQTVISQSIITYVIKEAMRLKIATFGFNHFFYDAGAALSFIINYQEIGSKIATLVKKVTQKGNCVSSGPPFTVLLNRKAIDTLGITMAQPLPLGVSIE